MLTVIVLLLVALLTATFWLPLVLITFYWGIRILLYVLYGLCVVGIWFCLYAILGGIIV